jgi:2-methylcitrate dehydratase PrpD
MITKEEITIKVPSDIAQAYHKFTEVEREQIEAKIADLLEAQLENRRKEAIKKLHQTMNEIGTKAVERGLTPGIQS